MRLIDADALYDKSEAWYKNAPTPYRKIYRSFIDIIADAPTIDPPPNDPLTLEQLREMDGEPVWVVQVNGELRPMWMLVDAEDESAAGRLYCAMFEDYGTEWLAYRRKPEEGETWQQ